VENKIPSLEDYLKKRDWVGAIVHLENERRYKNIAERMDCGVWELVIYLILFIDKVN